ncbi:hypothetical protein LUZ28_18480 [Streptomyces albireticuli]|nr:hypothetical protein [Streptomyces albireticuli]MCD9141601.1 hypothetical protein [Streptomyces albireticuli]MCD9164148.1 hypothetical protein [Streptomyces albireticuli]MCD9189775.1 hypothetical protein [Streptomyces albireticuli]
MDHPLLALEVAGTPAYLEPDAIVVHPDGDWTIVEIKSFPMIDGAADPGKVGAAARQAAVYALALEGVAARMGGGPGDGETASPGTPGGDTHPSPPADGTVPPTRGAYDEGDAAHLPPTPDTGRTAEAAQGADDTPPAGTRALPAHAPHDEGDAAHLPPTPDTGRTAEAAQGADDTPPTGTTAAPAHTPQDEGAAAAPLPPASDGGPVAEAPVAPPADGASRVGRAAGASVRERVLLVCPKDFSNLPDAELVDVRKQIATTRRQLARLTRVEDIAAALPEGTTFDLRLADDGRTATRPAAELAAAVEAAPAAYAPDCLAACELAFHCRARSRAADAVETLGRGVRGELGGLATVGAVLAAARGEEGDPADPAVAALRRAAALRAEALEVLSASGSRVRTTAGAAEEESPCP